MQRQVQGMPDSCEFGPQGLLRALLKEALLQPQCDQEPFPKGPGVCGGASALCPGAHPGQQPRSKLKEELTHFAVALEGTKFFAAWFTSN